MVYFIVIAIVLFVGSGIGVGFWVSSVKGKLSKAEIKIVHLGGQLEGWQNSNEGLQFVITERDAEIKRLNIIIKQNNVRLDELYRKLGDAVGFDVVDEMVNDIKDEVL